MVRATKRAKILTWRTEWPEEVKKLKNFDFRHIFEFAPLVHVKFLTTKDKTRKFNHVRWVRHHYPTLESLHHPDWNNSIFTYIICRQQTQHELNEAKESENQVFYQKTDELLTRVKEACRVCKRYKLPFPYSDDLDIELAHPAQWHLRNRVFGYTPSKFDDNSIRVWDRGNRMVMTQADLYDLLLCASLFTTPSVFPTDLIRMVIDFI